MSANNEKRPAIIVFSTIIISSIILASLTYLFYFYFIPFYQIDIEDFYTILVRILPLIIGLLLTIIALVVAPLNIPHTSSKDDEIPIDNYTAPLYNLPNEEKEIIVLETTEKVEPSDIQSSIVQNKLSPVETLYVSQLEPVKRPQSIDVEAIITPVVVHDIDTESLRTSIETEIDIELHPSYSNLDRAIDFSQYPFSIDENSSIASLLEPIEKSESVDLSDYIELTKQVEDSLEAVLKEELNEAIERAYPLSFALLSLEDDEDDLIVDTLYKKLSQIGIVYTDSNNIICAILPFYSYKRSQLSIASIIKSVKKTYPNNKISVGFSTSNDREVEQHEIHKEASLALELAIEQTTDSIIGFDSIIS
ncbi:MAG: hypothetical protein EOM67_01900 [Spirochaetia bacterium]|nr:hypothetical protein [Spirochaetia bacterium]